MCIDVPTRLLHQPVDAETFPIMPIAEAADRSPRSTGDRNPSSAAAGGGGDIMTCTPPTYLAGIRT